MGKQSTMTSGRSKKGQGGSAPSKGRKSQSATLGPTAEQSEGQPRLKLRMNKSGGTQNADTTLRKSQNLEFNYEPLQFVDLSLPVTTRTGRTVHRPKHLDTVESGEYEQAFEANSGGMGNANRAFESYVSSDPSYSSPIQQQRKRRGRPPKNPPPAEPALDTIAEEEEASPSSDTLEDQSTPSDDDDVYQIINVLNSTTRTHLDLPTLPTAEGTNYPPPYTARTLTQLYIFCYDLKQWDACDLVADTWIRAFHAVRAKSEKNPIYQIWRPNKALTRRKRVAREAWSRGQDEPAEFDPNPKDYALTVSDPEMSLDVTSMNINLLNTLYENTDATCGARLLWADALALSGDQTETAIDTADKRSIQLHPDLRFNIMQTSLRMVRRNLTLKIEESTEGAWCKRYHEHGKHKRMCYREKAWRYNNGIVNDGGIGGSAMGEEAEGEILDARGCVVDREELEMMDAVIRAEEAAQRGLKRGFEDGEAEMGAAKRVRFGEDRDAEGESEEE